MPSVKMLPLLPYIEFVELIAGADFIVTDGGSIQEECYYLNKPCMVMRLKTERVEGVGENSFLSKFNRSRIDHFFKILPELRREENQNDPQPSDVLVDYISSWACEGLRGP
jgi:UDP-N-acetylglucosamine 2-epimerase (non-hydrolysing)